MQWPVAPPVSCGAPSAAIARLPPACSQFPESEMASVELKDVRKSFGRVEVVHGVNVSIDDGEFVVLVGPSGCGKSTLLRMVAGLEEISAGEIRIGDKCRQQRPAQGARHRHGVPELRAVSAHDRVRQHGVQHEARGPQQRRNARSASTRRRRSSASPSISSAIPRQLSGGQRQRVAMGRAIVRDPQVFLFDEPLSNLDAKLRVQMRTEIKELHQRLKTTSVYVTHDQIEAMTMADKIVVMNGGNVEQIGSPLELYDNPANLFVAGFIGSPAMNFLPGRVGERQRRRREPRRRQRAVGSAPARGRWTRVDARRAPRAFRD